MLPEQTFGIVLCALRRARSTSQETLALETETGSDLDLAVGARAGPAVPYHDSSACRSLSVAPQDPVGAVVTALSRGGEADAAY